MMTEMEKDLAAAMDAGQVDDVENDDIESDIAATLEASTDEPEAKAEVEDESTEEAAPEEEDDTAQADEKLADEQSDDTDDASDVKIDKAPSSWTPANREHWAKLPDSVKQQVAKREREVNDVLQNSAADRKAGQSFTRAAEPYKALMASEGTNDPVQAFNGLMQTVSTLKMGSQEQKAKKISDLIGHYGVDINTLDQMLSGSPATAPTQNSELDQMLSSRLKPMEDMLNSYKQREQQQITTRNDQVTSDVEKFGAENEFFADVRNTMADAMDMATKQGRTMTLKDAYDFACNMTPEVKSVLQTRASHNDLGAKKKAAKSLNHKLGGTGGKDTPQGLEATIAAAWDGM